MCFGKNQSLEKSISETPANKRTTNNIERIMDSGINAGIGNKKRPKQQKS